MWLKPKPSSLISDPLYYLELIRLAFGEYFLSTTDLYCMHFLKKNIYSTYKSLEEKSSELFIFVYSALCKYHNYLGIINA